MEQVTNKLKEVEVKAASLTIELSELKTYIYTGLNRLQSLLGEKHEKMARVVKNSSDTTTRGQQAIIELESKLTKMQMRTNAIEKLIDSKVGPEEIMKVSELISREYAPLERLEKVAEEGARLRARCEEKVDRASYGKDLDWVRQTFAAMQESLVDTLRNEMQSVLDQYESKVDASESQKIMKTALREEIRKEKLELVNMFNSQSKRLEEVDLSLFDRFQKFKKGFLAFQEDTTSALAERVQLKTFVERADVIEAGLSSISQRADSDSKRVVDSLKNMKEETKSIVDSIRNKNDDELYYLRGSIDDLGRRTKIELKSKEQQIADLEQRLGSVYEEFDNTLNLVRSQQADDQQRLEEALLELGRAKTQLSSPEYVEFLHREIKKLMLAEEERKAEEERRVEEARRIKLEEDIRLGLVEPYAEFKGIQISDETHQKFVKLLNKLLNVDLQLEALKSALLTKVNRAQLEKRLEQFVTRPMLYGVRTLLEEFKDCLNEYAGPELRQRLEKLAVNHQAEFDAAWALKGHSPQSSGALRQRPATSHYSAKSKRRDKPFSDNESLDLVRGMQKLGRSIRRKESETLDKMTIELPPFFVESDFEDRTALRTFETKFFESKERAEATKVMAPKFFGRKLSVHNSKRHK